MVAVRVETASELSVVVLTTWDMNGPLLQRFAIHSSIQAGSTHTLRPSIETFPVAILSITEG